MQKYFSDVNSQTTLRKTPDSLKKFISPVKSDNTINSYITFGK